MESNGDMKIVGLFPSAFDIKHTDTLSECVFELARGRERERKGPIEH